MDGYDTLKIFNEQRFEANINTIHFLIYSVNEVRCRNKEVTNIKMPKVRPVATENFMEHPVVIVLPDGEPQ